MNTSVRNLNDAIAQLTSNKVMFVDFLTTFFGNMLLGFIFISEFTEYLPEIGELKPLLISFLLVESILIVKYLFKVHQLSDSNRTLLVSLAFERESNINGFIDWAFDLFFIGAGVISVLALLDTIPVFGNTSSLLLMGIVFIGMNHVKTRIQHVMYMHYDPEKKEKKDLSPEELDELSDEEIDQIFS